MIDCVAFMLIRDGALLAERRKLTRKLAPGVLSIPGGHVEPGEAFEAALRREAREELSIELGPSAFVCSLLHRAEEVRKLHYYAVTSWQGEIQCREASSLHWIALADVVRLDLEVDRTALREYQRNCVTHKD